MEEHLVWVTTRRIKPGTLTEFERARRPGPHPEGMVTACAYWSGDEQEVIGVSLWASRQSCDAWRARIPGHDGARPWVLTSLASTRRSTGAGSFTYRLASSGARGPRRTGTAG
jgi:hypothetical protein